MSDEFGRKSVADLVKDVGIRVTPGRLDKDSEGLPLTNDGEFSNLLLHPSPMWKNLQGLAKPALKDEDSPLLPL